MPRKNREERLAYHKDYNKEYYKRRKQYHLDRNKKRKQKTKEFIRSIKVTLSCDICGEDDIACLDFHHLDPTQKDKVISRINDWSEERILLEIQKCQVLCSNCHRKLHYYE